ncbi:MAG TPA: acyl-CoA dehydrogenase [Desulfobacterales bacterium]|nr:acyl-CoA dehydrogenase [Desulfobacterales bacterium]
MDFSIPQPFTEEMDRFKLFLKKHMVPKLSNWYRDREIPRNFFRDMGQGGWFGIYLKDNELTQYSALRSELIVEKLASISPGVAVATLAHVDLGLTALYLFGSKQLKNDYGKSAVRGETLMCLGNSESSAGSDVANISMTSEKVEGGWLLNGTKAFITNGLISDLAVITAISDAAAPRNKRLSMFLVNLAAEGIHRKKLNKQVWLPSDLTRIQFKNVFVPGDHLLGERGKGLQQVLKIFSYSRVPISALTLGTAVGAFELAVAHAKKRKIFGKELVDFQAKAFEIADLYAKMEAARLMIYRACEALDSGNDFRLEASLAKYLSVMTAREVTTWAADLFGAVSVISEHPIHKFPMDVWASSLGEGTQDVQKLVIFREIIKNF